MKDKIQLDNSGRKIAEQCKMQYFLKIINGLQSECGNTALRFGQTWHGIQEGYYKHIATFGWKTKDAAISAGIMRGKEIWDRETKERTFMADDYRTFENCVTMFMSYLNYFVNDENYIKVISTEKKFEIPIIPKILEEHRLLDGKPLLMFTGKIDLEVEMDGRIWGCDHKTTSFNLDKASNQLNRSAQFIGYYYTEKELEVSKTKTPMDAEMLEGFLISFAFASSYKSKTTGQYGNLKTDFRRIPQLYSQQDLIDWRKSFISTYKDILFCIENDYWPIQYDSCYNQFNRSCEYLRLCDQKRSFEDLNLTGYKIQHWNVLNEEE